MSIKTPAYAFYGLVLVALSGCAGNSDAYPSLAVRDAERPTDTSTPAPPAQRPSIAPETLQSVTATLDRAQAVHARFIAARPQAAALAASARGRDDESDLRAQALIAMADLATMHSETALALADLDRIEVDAATQFASLAEIRFAQGEIEVLMNAQDSILNALWSEIDG